MAEHDLLVFLNKVQQLQELVKSLEQEPGAERLWPIATITTLSFPWPEAGV